MHLSICSALWVFYGSMPRGMMLENGDGQAGGARQITPETVVLAGSNAISSSLLDEIVILNLHSGIYHGLECVGARIWQMIAQPAAVHSLRDALLDEYEVDPARCEEDLIAFLEELKSNGLLDVQCASVE